MLFFGMGPLQQGWRRRRINSKPACLPADKEREGDGLMGIFTLIGGVVVTSFSMAAVFSLVYAGMFVFLSDDFPSYAYIGGGLGAVFLFYCIPDHVRWGKQSDQPIMFLERRISAAIRGMFSGDGTSRRVLKRALGALESGDHHEAEHLLMSLMEKGDREATYHLGMLYRTGGPGATEIKDDNKAVECLVRSANQGHETARSALQQMADGGYAPAQYYMGALHKAEATGGPGDAASLIEAGKWFCLAAEQGDMDSIMQVTMLYQVMVTGGARSGDGTADGDVNGMIGALYDAFGRMYMAGQVGEQADPGQAREWFTKAAEKGFADGMVNMGILYRDGAGVEKDLKQAASWYLKAAEHGSAKAQNNLGVMHYNGEGVEKDPAKAAEWYLKAAQQGFSYSQATLGDMHLTGDGVAEDPAAAVRWYSLAADQGHQGAQAKMATLYRDGIGVESDPVKARMWAVIAAKAGSVEAMMISKQLGETLAAEQAEEADRLAEQWQPGQTGGAETG